MDRESRSIKSRKTNNEQSRTTDRARNTRSDSRSSVRSNSYNRKNDRSKKNQEPKANTALQKRIGLGISAVLLLTMIAFTWALLTLNMLPFDYVLIIMMVLLLIWLGITARQILAKKRATGTKVLALLLAIGCGTTAFYVHQTNTMLLNITNNSGVKIDDMAVVVLIDNPAETLEDARNYNFGVQYSLQGQDVTETIEHIEEVLGKSVTTTEYTNVGEQAQALLDGEVDAIIYNDAYSTIVEEEHPEYPILIKVIHSYEIETEVEEKTVVGDITSEAFAVYISGIDVYGAISKTSRSDVNIIMYVNPSTKQILLVNTPRDYYVTFPGVTGSSKDKLTHAGIYGVATSVKTLENLYSSDIDYYARVNFTSLIDIVDALGGLEVYSSQSFTTMHGNYKVNKGMNTFTGAQALGFSRERYSLSGGDNDRGKNQQAVITAMIQKVTSPAIITGATRILTSVSGSVDTDMPQADIQALIKSQISSGGSWNVKSMAATGTGDSQYCYSYSGSRLYVMQPNLSSVNKIKNAIQALENGDVLTDAIVAQ